VERMDPNGNIEKSIPTSKKLKKIEERRTSREITTDRRLHGVPMAS
jgi:hypothetical protein